MILEWLFEHAKDIVEIGAVGAFLLREIFF